MKAGKTIHLCILFFLLAGFVFGQRPVKTFVQDEVLVKFRSGVNKSSIHKTNSLIGSNLLENFTNIGWSRIKLPRGLSVEKAIVLYIRSDEVEAAQPNFYYHLLVTPNDPEFITGMYGLTNISAPSAWDLTTGSSTVVVANIDTGLRYTHEDIAANAWKNPGEIDGNGIDDDGNGFVDDYNGYDFRYNDPDPLDQNGHGTHTAGTIGAVGNNGVGVVGVNWNVRLMSIKIFSPAANDTTTAMLLNAYNYVTLMKNRGINIRVTNNSYGGFGEDDGFDQATKDAINVMGNAGILNVFAAGNRNVNNDIFAAAEFPASYTSPSIISVAASTSTDDRAPFSNYGAISVDLAAPGFFIRSTTNGSDSSYGTLSGTSMATPHVAGAAALLSAYNPDLSAASLKATLLNTVDQLPQLNGLVRSGGRLNVSNALRNQTVCSFNLANSSIVVPTKGGTFSVNVTAPQNCDFAVISPVKWVHIAGPDAMSGNATVNFHVTINPTVYRSAVINIAGQSFSVVQSRNGIL